MNSFRSPLSSLTPVVKNLLIINILVFLGSGLIGRITNENPAHILGLHFFASEYFRPWQYITHMFMHGGFTHLFFNMFALFMFGRILEQVWGPKRFLLYYAVCGLGAAALHTMVMWLDYNSMQTAFEAFKANPDPALLSKFISDQGIQLIPEGYSFIDSWTKNPESVQLINYGTDMFASIINSSVNVPTVGASGAVFGLLLAYGMLFPNSQLMLLFPPIPIRAKYFVLIYGVLEFFLGVRAGAGDNVAHFAHLGGMLFGFLLIKYWNKYGTRFY